MTAVMTQEESVALELDQRWHSITRRDAGAEGRFFYAVKTTGVYCRPACAARLPRRENVEFFESAAEAERAGYRACLRCRPNEQPLSEAKAKKVADACRRIAEAENTLSLAELAKDAGMSPYHFHRLFKDITGVTPRAYGRAGRAERVREELRSAHSVTDAIYGAGYQSNGRFYGEAGQMLGMTPSEYRNQGARAEIRYEIGRCSLGSILVAASNRGVCAILLGDAEETLTEELRRRFARAQVTRGGAAFQEWMTRVIEYVDGPGRGWDLPLDIRGTAFQQKVWEALRQVEPGSTASYAEIAEKLGMAKGARAVAQACAANALAVVVPCHRIVRSDGDVSGYRWGAERKRALLAREARLAGA